MKALLAGGGAVFLAVGLMAGTAMQAAMTAPSAILAQSNDAQQDASGAAFQAAAVPAQYQDLVARAGKVCPEITSAHIAAQIEAESNWNPNAGSPAGAQGIAQFMPAAWASYGADYDHDGTNSPTDPGDAIPAQAKFMCELVSWAKRDVKAGKVSGAVIDLALAGYNAGWGAVQQAHGVPAIPETQNYVKRIKSLVSKYEVGTLVPGHGTSVITLVRAGKRVPGWRMVPSDGAQTAGLPTEMLDKAKRSATYRNARIPRELLCPVPGGQLRCDAAYRWKQLNAAYRAKWGTDIPVTSSYRDLAEQEAAVAVSTPGYAAEPGTSPHGWGLAIDLGYPAGNLGTPQKAWLVANMPTYGWWWPTWMRQGSPDYELNEPWHYEFAEGWILP